MSFMERLRKVKAEKKLTTADLSRLSGVPTGTLNKLFTGVTEEPKLSVAYALARAMDCTLDELCSEGAENDCLTPLEKRLVDAYRAADEAGRDIILTVAQKEADRQAAVKPEIAEAPTFAESGKILLPLYLLPVSAGRGAILDGDDCETIEVRNTRISSQATFALRVSGNSMEPTFRENDTLLVRKQSSVEKGELGIFIGDGEGFFKCFLGDRLHSLNPKYADIPIGNFAEFVCCGKVIGKIAAKA